MDLLLGFTTSLVILLVPHFATPVVAICTETPAVPRSDAVLCGNGDVYSRKPLGQLKLEGTELGSIQALAGSWVYLYEATFYPPPSNGDESVRKPEFERIERACKLHEAFASKGLVVIAVSAQPNRPEFGYPPLNHPLWVTTKVSTGRSGDFGREPLLDWPEHSGMLVDPAGLIALGGRTAVDLGFLGVAVDAGNVETLVNAVPALTLQDCAAGSKLREAIAKRNWKEARSLAAVGSDRMKQSLEGILEAEASWAESLCEKIDPLSARARVLVLKSLPSDDPVAVRALAVDKRLKSEKSLVDAARLEERLVALARKMTESWRYGVQYYSTKDFQTLDADLRAVEAAKPMQTNLVIAKALRQTLDSKSPLTPCSKCKRPRGDCKCR
jgi:hypothetical protein